MTSITTVVMDEKTIKNLDKIANKVRKSKSEVIRYLINRNPEQTIEELLNNKE